MERFYRLATRPNTVIVVGSCWYCGRWCWLAPDDSFREGDNCEGMYADGFGYNFTGWQPESREKNPELEKIWAKAEVVSQDDPRLTSY